MASAHLDLVRSIYADWGRGDFFGSAEWAEPDIEWVLVPEPARAAGLEVLGWSSGLATSSEPGRKHYAKADEYPNSTTAECSCLSAAGHGKTSGLIFRQVRAEDTTVYQIAPGKVTSVVLYFRLGLTPEGDSP